MKKKGSKQSSIVKRAAGITASQADFDQILGLIGAARTRAVAAVDTAMIDLYWSIGQHISQKIAEDGWGKGTVTVLADYIRRRLPNARGFSAQNLWRMRQFFDTYQADPKPMPRQSSRTAISSSSSTCPRDTPKPIFTMRWSNT